MLRAILHCSEANPNLLLTLFPFHTTTAYIWTHLARTSLDDDVTVLAESRTLHWEGERGTGMCRLEILFMSFGVRLRFGKMTSHISSICTYSGSIVFNRYVEHLPSWKFTSECEEVEQRFSASSEGDERKENKSIFFSPSLSNFTKRRRRKWPSYWPRVVTSPPFFSAFVKVKKIPFFNNIE